MSRREVNTADMPIHQKADVVLPTSGAIERDPEVIAAERQMDQGYYDALEFNEGEITIIIAQSSEKFAPKFIDIWCNGKGAEIKQGNKWLVTGALPIGAPVTTRRKYVEILANSKIDTVTTPEVKPGDPQDERVIRQTNSRAVFSVMGDVSPREQEWLRRILWNN